MEGTEIIQDVNKSSRTELDSHANMPVIGINAYILSKIGETVDVAPFNRNMSKSKGWTLQSSLLTLWMDENSNQQSNKNW